MSSMFSKSVGFVHGSAMAFAGEEVVYSRGGVSVSPNPMALIGETDHEGIVQEAVQVDAISRDFLIDASSLSIGGNAIIPKHGDLITQTVNGAAVRFAVSPPSRGIPEWRWTDATHTRYRIHTKEVAA